MSADTVVPLLAWGGLVTWLAAATLLWRRRLRAAAVLHALLALTFVAPFAFPILAWAIDPAAYARRNGAAAVGELRFDAAVLLLGLLILLGAALEWRGRRWPGFAAAVLSAAGVALYFYFAYFFHIF